MSWAFLDGTIDESFVLSEDDGERRLVFIDRVAAEDAFPKSGGQGKARLGELLRANIEAIQQTAIAKFAAGGGFRHRPDLRPRVTLSAAELTRDGPLAQN